MIQLLLSSAAQSQGLFFFLLFPDTEAGLHTELGGGRARTANLKVRDFPAPYGFMMNY